MNNALDSFRSQYAAPVRTQIAEHLRQAIRQGRLAAGSKLPPTQELAATWQTQPAIVQAAMTMLVKEGLIERRPHYGTFVQQSAGAMTHVGIYLHGEVWETQGNSFYGCLIGLLSQNMRQRKIQPDIWIDQRADRATGVPWKDLEQATHRREIQGLIVLAALDEERKWLSKLPVPVVHTTIDSVPNRVRLGLAESLPEVMASLSRRGCHSVGLISVMPRHQQDPSGRPHGYDEFYGTFLQSAAQHGLAVSESWNYTADRALGERMAEEFGYKAFNGLWAQRQHPEALLVYTDVAARGVLWAAIQQQVNVPRDLHLVLHRNAEAGLFCPVPASFLDMPVTEMAVALISQLEALHLGKEPASVTIPLHLIE